MKKVWIEPGCITCGACEFVCPEIFEVKDKSYIKDSALDDINNKCELFENAKLAASSCPVQVIKTEE